MFKVRPDKYWINQNDAELLHAGEASFITRTGPAQPGVALFHDTYVKFVLNPTEARRLANEILQKLEKSENIHNTEGVTS